MGSKQKIMMSMAIFGTVSVFVKNIPVSSGEIALFRAIIAVVVIALFLLITGGRIQFSKIKKDLPALFLSGAAIGFNWILLFQAYKYTTVSMATLSYYFAPVIILAVSCVLFKEKLTARKILCFVMATIGLVMVIGINGAGITDTSLAGIGFGLGAALLYASVVLVNKYIKNVAGIDRTLIQFLAAIIVLIPYLLATSGIHPGNLGGVGILNVMILGVVHTGLCYCLYFSSLKDLEGQEAAILSYIDPVVAIFVSVLVLQEAIYPMQIVGGSMILGFTLLNELKK